MHNLIIIGSGSAGVSAAEAAVAAGAKKVAMVEGRDRLGGECPNRACVPTKALLRSVEVLELARRAGEFGIQISALQFDFKHIMDRRHEITDLLTKPPRLENLLENLKVELIRGWAKFVGPNEIEVRGKRYQAEKFIIATGSEYVVPPIEGLESAGFITSDDLVEFKQLPGTVVIIGGGPVGCELAQILAPLGVAVTIVEFTPHILPREEPEIAGVVAKALEQRGVKILTNTKVIKVDKKNGELALTVIGTEKSADPTSYQLQTTALMIAAGKRPAVAMLDLDRAGVKLNERGAPVVNEYLQTNQPHIYFAGDAVGQMFFTHVAHREGEIAGQNAVNGNAIKLDLTVVPRGTFTSLEVGSVGLTEAEAREKNFDVGVGAAPYVSFGKALVTGEQDGLVKIIVDKRTGLVLGGHVVGQSAAELVHEVALAMQAKIPYTTIAEMIHAYPTYAEAIGAAASLVQ